MTIDWTFITDLTTRLSIALVLGGLIGLEILNAIIPQIGTTTVALKFTAKSKESIKRVIEQLKNDSQEIYSYELKDRRTPAGESYEASLELKVKRGNHNERLIEYMEEFDDVTISSIE